MLPTKKFIANRQILGYVYDTFIPSSIYHQILRWRKPFYLPMAKSKVFRIPPERIHPKEEKDEFMKLYNHYRTFMKSLRQYCKEEVEKSQEIVDDAHLQKIEDEDFERCMKINDEWNKKLANEREVRRAKEKDERVLNVMKHMEKVDRKLEAERNVVEARIRMAKQQSITFITEENIDQAIEEAMNTTVNYNKVLDLNGNYYEVKSHPRQAAQSTVQQNAN